MKILWNIITVISVIFLIWFGISYIEVLTQNLNCNSPTILSNWNLFTICSILFE